MSLLGGRRVSPGRPMVVPTPMIQLSFQGLPYLRTKGGDGRLLLGPATWHCASLWVHGVTHYALRFVALRIEAHPRGLSMQETEGWRPFAGFLLGGT